MVGASGVIGVVVALSLGGIGAEGPVGGMVTLLLGGGAEGCQAEAFALIV